MQNEVPMKNEALQYPYRETGIRPPLERREAVLLSRDGNAAGRARPSVEARSFIKRMAGAVFHARLLDKLPKWVLAQVEKGVSVVEFVDLLKKRTLRAPSEENLHLALALANEIMRKERGPQTLRQALTQELVDELSDERRAK